MKVGPVHYLVHVSVHHARQARNLLADCARDCVIAWVVHRHLHIDWIGKTKVQDLADDVCWLEIEGQLRKAKRQFAAQLADVFLRRPVLAFLERHQNLSIESANRRAVSKRKVKRFRRPPDIVKDQLNFRLGDDFTKLFFHPAEDDLGALQAQSRRGAHVHTKLSCVHLRKEIAADEWKQYKSRCHHQPGKQECCFTAIEKTLEQSRVAGPDGDVTVVEPGVQSAEPELHLWRV